MNKGKDKNVVFLWMVSKYWKSSKGVVK